MRYRRILTSMMTVFLLCGCQTQKEGSTRTLNNMPEKGMYLYEYAGITEVSKIVVGIDSEGSVTESTFEKEELSAVLEAFKKITISEESDIFVTDAYSYIKVYDMDNNVVYIRLNGMNLEVKVDGSSHIFTMDHFKDFWKLV